METRRKGPANTQEKPTSLSHVSRARGVPRAPTGRGEVALRSQETSPASGRWYQGLEDPDEQEEGGLGRTTPGGRSCGPGGRSGTPSGAPRQQHNPMARKAGRESHGVTQGVPVLTGTVMAAGTKDTGWGGRGPGLGRQPDSVSENQGEEPPNGEHAAGSQ